MYVLRHLLFLICFLSLAVGSTLLAQTTYTTIAGGLWSSPLTWDANGVPPEPIPAGDNVVVNHLVITNGTAMITNNGEVTVNADGTARIQMGAPTHFINNGTFNGFATGLGNPLFINDNTIFDNYGYFRAGLPGQVAIRHNGGNFNNKNGGNLDFAQGSLIFQDGDARFVNEQGGQFTLGAAANSQLTTSFLGSVATGLVFVNAGIFDAFGNIFMDEGSGENSSTGVMNIHNSWDLSNDGFVNDGTINTSSASARIDLSTTLNSTNGTINHNNNFFRGSGTLIIPTFVNNAVLVPIKFFLSPDGTLDITGNYDGDGDFRTFISSNDPNDLGRIAVTGTADITQEILRVFFLGAFSPSVGDEFEIISAAGGITGPFSSTSLPFLGTDKEWEIEYNPTTVVLKVVSSVQDSDEDGVNDDVDNCPNAFNPNQEDNDNDQIGDVCDPDDDNDGCPDEEDPTPFDPAVIAMCTDITVKLDANGSATVPASQIGVGSIANCGPASETVNPSSFNCNNLGDNTVTYTVMDANGTSSSCTATVTIEGLPCGYSSNPNGINCPNGSVATYNPATDTYMITSEGCYDPNYYSNMDSHGYLGTQLCGNGEIIAEITSISGNGYAGISMREDLSAGSKMMQMSIDGVSLSKRELRQSSNGLAFNHIFQTFGRNWLRLTRSGNQFTAQHSTDGTSWSTVIATTITMPNCIEVGMFTENKTQTGSMTATFENVEVNASGIPLTAPGTPGIDIAAMPDREVSIFPNPTNGEAFIGLDAYIGQSARIEVYNNQGQSMQLLEIDSIEVPNQRLDLNGYQNGLYFIKVQIADQPVITRKLMLVGE